VNVVHVFGQLHAVDHYASVCDQSRFVHILSHNVKMFLSLPFKGHFPGELYCSLQPVFIEAKDDGGGSNNWTTGAISHAKLQSNHYQQTNIQYFYRLDALPVAQPTVSKH